MDKLLSMSGVNVLRMEAKPQKSDRRGFLDVMAKNLGAKVKAIVAEVAKFAKL